MTGNEGDGGSVQRTVSTLNVGNDHLKLVYPKWDDCLKLRAELDSNGRFMNGMLEGAFP